MSNEEPDVSFKKWVEATADAYRITYQQARHMVLREMYETHPEPRRKSITEMRAERHRETQP